MPYTLVIGDYAYSDKSMRAWLTLDAADIDFRPKYVPLFSEEYESVLVEHAPASSLPVLLSDTDDQADLIWESAAAAEILAERHPDAEIWPEAREAREIARSLGIQANTRFHALQALPMNLHARYNGYVPNEVEKDDLDAVTQHWEWALDRLAGPYLCGEDFCAADAAFAPLATRLVTYGFTMTDAVKTYVEAVYAHPSFRRWHACADAQLRRIAKLHQDLPSGSNKEWPRLPTLPGRPYEGAVSNAVNKVCPYSGLAIAADSIAEIDGQVVGFCNPFCCRRGMADAESWPSVMAAMGR